MKVLITGAHFTPAVAVIEILKEETDIEIVYVGRNSTLEGDNSQSVESKILPSLGVKFISLTAGRLRRNLSIYTLFSLLKVPIGFIQALVIILEEKPDVILSFGGYVGMPVVIMGWLFSVPIIIHEQTLVSGLANKISSFFADKVALGFNQKLLNTKTIFTGNPLRDQILNPQKYVLEDEYLKFFDQAKKEKKPLLLITGGNQGSHLINVTVEKILDQLTKQAFIIHITGDSKFKDFERLKNLQNSHYIVKKWIGNDIGNVLSKIDLAVSRAGANTLTELAYFKKPALVIPLPFIYKNEQMVNARFFEKLGLVKILPQSTLTYKSLQDEISWMISNLNNFNINTKELNNIVVPDAPYRLALETILLAKKSSSK